MKILLSSSHSFPAQMPQGRGLNPTPFPSSSAYSTFDLLCKGLVEIGQDVTYFLENGVKEGFTSELPISTHFSQNFDINHRMLDSVHNSYWKDNPWYKPYIISCHIHPKYSTTNWGIPNNKWVCPSKFLASALNINRFVYNGINPEEYVYSSTKDDYFLFMGSMEWGRQKGIEKAIQLSEYYGTKLIVLGGAKTSEKICDIINLCASHKNIQYLGDVRGQQKADLLAGAKCLIFPTMLDESFGICIVEALISGTPVICSDRGACAEIVNNQVGFVCKNDIDYYQAIENLSTISPAMCHKLAIDQYHYKKMAENFLTEYQLELE